MKKLGIEKVTLNIGVGKPGPELEKAMKLLNIITGEKPVETKTKKRIPGFGIRPGLSIGCKVTLRGDRMYEFFDRLVNIAIPRIRDFRGVSRRAFDGYGNFTLGIKEQIVFPEIDYDDVYKIRGMNIVFVIQNSRSREASIELLTALGMPFARG